MKLYHYVHCPFCIRVRMGLSFLAIPYESIVLPYDDELTPLQLTGKKMLPILMSDDGKPQDESLDILKMLDKNGTINWQLLVENNTVILPLLDKIGSMVHSLAMPYWIWTPEFNEQSRHYFQTKKEAKRGLFKDLVFKHEIFAEKLNIILSNELVPNIKLFYKSEKLTILDIMIAAHLWGMYVVPEYQFEPRVHEYLMRVKDVTHFNYHEDFWR